MLIENNDMDIFFELSTNKVLETPLMFKRYLLNNLPQNQKLVIIKVARGTENVKDRIEKLNL